MQRDRGRLLADGVVGEQLQSGGLGPQRVVVQPRRRRVLQPRVTLSQIVMASNSGLRTVPGDSQSVIQLVATDWAEAQLAGSGS